MIASQSKISAFVSVYQKRKLRAFGCNRNFYLTKRLDGFRGRDRSLPLPSGVLGRYGYVMTHRRLLQYGLSSFGNDIRKMTWVWN